MKQKQRQIPQILPKKSSNTNSGQPSRIYDNNILLQADQYEQLLENKDESLYGYYIISTDYETPCILQSVDFTLRTGKIFYFDKDGATKYIDTVPLNQIRIHSQFAYEMNLKLKMPIQQSMYVHDQYYNSEMFKNATANIDCQPQFVDSFLHEFKRYSKQFMSIYNNNTNDPDVMFALLSNFKRIYSPITESARVDYTRAKEALVQSGLDENVRIMRYVRQAERVDVKKMISDLNLTNLSKEKEILLNQLLISKQNVTFIETGDKIFKFFREKDISHLLQSFTMADQIQAYVDSLIEDMMHLDNSADISDGKFLNCSIFIEHDKISYSQVDETTILTFMESIGHSITVPSSKLYNRMEDKQLNKDYLLQQIGAPEVILSIVKILGAVSKIIAGEIEFKELDDAQVDKNFYYVSQLMKRQARVYNINDYIQIHAIRIDLTQVKQFLIDKLGQMIDKANQSINAHFDSKIAEMYRGITSKQAQFEETPDTPGALVDLSRSIDGLQAFVKDQLTAYIDFLEEFMSYGQHYEPEKPSFGEALGPGDIVTALLALWEKRSFTKSDFSHQQRIFSKMLLELTDFIQFYANQVEMCENDVIKMQLEMLKPENKMKFKRLYRWLYAGFQYEGIENFFDVNQELFGNFIKSVEEQSGVKVTEFNKNKFYLARTESTAEGQDDTGATKDNFNLQKSLQELMFVCGAMEQIYDITVGWSQTLNVECFMTLNPHDLKIKIEPIASILLSTSLLKQQFKGLQDGDEYLCDVNVSQLCATCRAILEAIRVIRADSQYESWRAQANQTETDVMDMYSRLHFLEMVSYKQMTNFHYTKLSYSLSMAINAELRIKVSRILDMLEDDSKYEYYFHQIAEIYNSAVKNAKYMEYINDMTHFVNSLELKTMVMSFESSYEYQFYQNLQFSYLYSEKTVGQLLNQYLYEIGDLLQHNLIPQTQKILRDLEANMIILQQFVINTSRSRVIITDICSHLNMYLSERNQSRFIAEIHPHIKNLVLLSQKLDAKKHDFDMPKLIIGNQAITRQYTSALYLLEQNYNNFSIQHLLKHEHLYDTMEIKMEFDYKDESKKIITAMKCNGEVLELEFPGPNATFRECVARTIETKVEQARAMLKKQEYQQYLEEVHYQIFCQTICFVDLDELKKFIELLKNPSEKLKARGKYYLSAVANRINEFLNDPDIIVDHLTKKRFAKYQILIEDSLSTKLYWQGGARKEDTMQLSDEMYETMYECINAMHIGIPTFLLSGRIRHYDRVELFQMLSFSSRVLNCRYTIYNVATCQTEEEIEDDLVTYVLAGYMIMICGVQFLTLKQLNKILFICNSIANGTGKFEGIEHLGGIIILLPTLCSTNKNVQMTPQTTDILKVFQFRKDILFHNDMEASFKPYCELYYKEIAYISMVISCMEYTYPNIKPQDMPFVLSRIQNQTDKLQVANSVFCFLVHQTSDEIGSAIKDLVSSAFNLKMDQLSDDFKQFKQAKQHEELSAVGNYYFELLQFYVRMSIVALVGKAQLMSHMMAQQLARLNKWRIFWIFSFEDLKFNIDYISEDPENTLIVFNIVSIDDVISISLYKTILTLNIPNQPIEINGRFYFLHGIKSIVVMNSFDEEGVLETPLCLIGRRVKVTTNYLNLHYVIKNALIEHINIHFHDTHEVIIHDLKSFKKQAMTLSHYITPEEQKQIDTQQHNYNIYVEIFDDVIDVWLSAFYEIVHIDIDIRGWQILRMALIVYMSLVGIYKIGPHDYEHMPCPDLHKGKNNMVRYVMTNLGGYQPFDIFAGHFMHFKETTHIEFFQGHFDEINEKLVLALFCSIYNSFSLLISQHYHDDQVHSKYFNKFKALILERSQNIRNISKRALEVIGKISQPPSTFHYITNVMHQHIEIETDDEDDIDENSGSGSDGSFGSGNMMSGQSFGSLNEQFSSNDNMMAGNDDPQQPQQEHVQHHHRNSSEEAMESLKWVEYRYGHDLFDSHSIHAVITPEVPYEIPIYFTPEQTVQIIYILNTLLCELPIMIVGPDQSGKTTLVKAAVAILPQLVKLSKYVITSNVDFSLMIERIIQSMNIVYDGSIEKNSNQVDVSNIQVVTQGIKNKNTMFGQLQYFMGQNLVILQPSGYKCIRPNIMNNQHYFGILKTKGQTVVMEVDELPPQFSDSQSLIIHVKQITRDECVKLIKETNSRIDDDIVQEFTTGLFLVLPYLPCSIYSVLKKMQQLIIFVSRDDKYLQDFCISTFINAIKFMPSVTIHTINKVMDEIKAALSLGTLKKDSFWGGLDIGYMHQLIKDKNQEMLDKLQVHQFSSWELTVYDICREYSVTLQSEDEEDSDEAKQKEAENPPDIPDPERKKEKPKLQILQAQTKFKHALIMKNDLKTIDQGIFELYIQLYQGYCKDMDPSLCNKMLQMHIEMQQELERNSARLHKYMNAIKHHNVALQIELQDNFRLPIYMFNSFQMPAGQYNDQIQLLATLGNYQISNVKLFTQVNAKRLEMDASLGSSSSSSSMSSSSMSSSSSSSSSSYSSSIASSHFDQSYNHQVHARRQRRLLIDIQTLLQTVTKELKERQERKQKRDKHKYDNQLTAALAQCIQQKGEVMAVGYAIRAAFCQALGVSPIVGLQNLELPEPMQTSYGGQVQPTIPYVNDVINLVQSVLTKTEIPGNFDDLNLHQLMEYAIIQEPIDVMVVVPLSQLFQLSDTFSLMSTIQAATVGSSILYLFSNQEIKVLCTLVQYNFGLETALTPQQLMAIASRSFALAIISDLSEAYYLRVPFTPVARHSIIEQRQNAFIAGQLDNLVYWPLFKMTKMPLIKLSKLRIPDYILQNDQQKQKYIQDYCKTILSVFTFCEENMTHNHLELSLNAFARIAIRIVNKRLRKSLNVIKALEPLLQTLKTIEMYQNTQEYTSQQREVILKLKETLAEAKARLKYDYQRNVEYVKNAPADGALIAARLLYYPFMKTEFKTEHLFEIGLSENLRTEKITAFSISENADHTSSSIRDLITGREGIEDAAEKGGKFTFISDVKQNVSGVQSHIIGLLLEMLAPHWQFLKYLESGKLQTNFIAETVCLIICKTLRIKFPFLEQDIAPQIIEMVETYHKKLDNAEDDEDDPDDAQNVAEAGDPGETVLDTQAAENKIEVRIINCCLPHDKFCQAFLKALEFVKIDQPILFENYGSPSCPPENMVMIQKIQILYLTQITKKKQVINISKLKFQLKKAIHRYRFYYSMQDDSSYENLVELGIVNQSSSDMSIVVRCNLQVFNTIGNVLYELGSATYRLIFNNIIDFITQDFQRFSLDLKKFEVILMADQRQLQLSTYQALADLAAVLKDTKTLQPKSFTDKQLEQIEAYAKNIITLIDGRVGLHEEVLGQVKIKNVSTQIAKFVTSIFVLAANMTRVQLSMAAIFSEQITREFRDYLQINMTGNASTQGNIQGELIINILPYLLSRMIPLLPEKYKQSFTFLAYLYYNVCFKLAHTSDINLIKHMFCLAFKPQEDQTAMCLSEFEPTLTKKYGLTLDQFTPPIFRFNEVLNYSWRLLGSFNQFHERFDEYFTFYQDNHALFSELILAPTVYDAILGNYYYKMCQSGGKQRADAMFNQQLQQVIVNKPTSLPFSIQQPNLETLWSGLILGMMIQPGQSLRMMTRYNQLVPMSPHSQIMQQQKSIHEFYQEQLEAANLIPELYNIFPSLIYQESLKAINNRKAMLIFCDKGLAINILVRLVVEYVLQKQLNATLKETLMPTQQDLEENIVCVDTSFNIHSAIKHLLGLFKHGFEPKKLLIVIVPQEWKNRIGNENVDSHGNRMDNVISEYSHMSCSVMLYLQRPQTLPDAICHYLTLTTALCKREGIDFGRFNSQHIYMLFVQIMKYAVPMSKNMESVEDYEFLIDLYQIIKQIKLHRQSHMTYKYTPPSLCKVTWMKIPGFSTTSMDDSTSQLDKVIVHDELFISHPGDQLRQSMQMAENINLQDIIQFVKKLKSLRDESMQNEIQKRLINPQYINQKFNLVPGYIPTRVFRDFVNFIATEDIKVILTDEYKSATESHFHDQSNYSLIPQSLKVYMQHSLQRHHINSNAHLFTKQGKQTMIQINGYPTLVPQPDGTTVTRTDSIITIRGAVYKSIIGDMFQFIKLDNAQILGIPAHKLEIVGFMSGNPVYRHYVDIHGKIRVDKSKPDNLKHLVVTDYRLQGTSFCGAMKTITDHCTHSIHGYNQQFPIFFTVAEIEDTEYEQSVNEAGVRLVPIPLKCGGSVTDPYIYMPCKSSITDEEWQEKNSQYVVGFW